MQNRQLIVSYYARDLFSQEFRGSNPFPAPFITHLRPYFVRYLDLDDLRCQIFCNIGIVEL